MSFLKKFGFRQDLVNEWQLGYFRILHDGNGNLPCSLIFISTMTIARGMHTKLTTKHTMTSSAGGLAYLHTMKVAKRAHTKLTAR